MKVIPIKVKPVVLGSHLFDILDQSILKLDDRSILAITSKIVAICEERVIKIGEKNKDDLIFEESDYYLFNENYNFPITIKNNILIGSSGVDESNGNGYYILWPKDPQIGANKIRDYLMNKFKVKNLGVLIVDSKSTPLRRGVTGISIAHSGFKALNDYVGKKDIFGRTFKSEKANIADSIASAAVVAMGEGDEQTPLSLISDLPQVEFQKFPPSKEELEELSIGLEDDLYAPIWASINWKKRIK